LAGDNLTVSIKIADWQTAPARAIRPLFAIGDVHGRDDLFAPLIETIEGLASRDGLDAPLLIALGDYIDRGPAGIRALQRALDGASSIVKFVSLPGNHEQFLRTFLEARGQRQAEIIEFWFNNGGTSVALELGLAPDEMLRYPDAFARAIRQSLGAERLSRLSGLRNHVRIGGYLFVHAGIHPDLGLSMLNREWDQMPSSWSEEDSDPLWVRGPFLTYEGVHEDGVVVVHGHTPRREAELLPNRINVDTRAYDTGRLTAVQLDGSRLRLIQAIGDAIQPPRSRN
jgi:serine/threonine protein phosphatase 1